MEILVISYSAPFDAAGSAGEKTHNYYLKAFQKEKGIHVRLISFCKEKDEKKLDLDKYKITNKVLVEKQDKFSVCKRKLIRACGLVFRPYDKYANFVSRVRKKYISDTLKGWKAGGYIPDCIILEWTHMVLLADMVKNIYPDVIIVASEHDISYIGSERRWKYEANKLVKYFRRRQYENLKLREIEALEECDMIVPHNCNDLKIFRSMEQLKNKEYFRIVPYYDDYAHIVRKPERNMMIFYGNIGRSENYISVQWFVEHVFRKLSSGWQFVIIGGNPPQTIKGYASGSIRVTGFLEQGRVEELFAKCKCMVAPLQLGSGIKVKVLEAFSAGIPVLTNSIGIEGIYAQDGKEYIHCETADDYIRQLDDVAKGKLNLEPIGVAGRKFLKKRHNLEQSRLSYIQKLRECCQKTD